jgi:hypothetical protein
VPHPFLPNVPLASTASDVLNETPMSAEDGVYIMQSTSSGSYLSLLCDSRDHAISSDEGTNGGVNPTHASEPALFSSHTPTSRSQNDDTRGNVRDTRRILGYGTLSKKPIPEPRKHVRPHNYANTNDLAKRVWKIRKSKCSRKSDTGTACHGQSTSTGAEQDNQRLAHIALASGMRLEQAYSTIRNKINNTSTLPSDSDMGLDQTVSRNQQ